MKLRNEFKAGLFVIACLVLFCTSIFIMGQERQIFAKQIEYHTTFKDAQGLSEGAPIRVGGISIGRVDKIDFAESAVDPRIHVVMLISEKYSERLKTDCVASLETQGLLGDKFIGISPGSSREALRQGADIQSKENADLAGLVDEVRNVVTTTSSIVTNVNEVVARMKGDGLDNVVKSTESISRMLKQIETGKGTLHDIIYSDQLGKDFGRTASSLADSAGTIKLLTEKVQQGPNLLHSLIFDKSETNVAEMVKNLSQVASNLQKATDALANGSGTLGALLVDPSLYNNLIEITDGAKRSFLLRKAINMSLDK